MLYPTLQVRDVSETFSEIFNGSTRYQIERPTRTISDTIQPSLDVFVESCSGKFKYLQKSIDNGVGTQVEVLFLHDTFKVCDVSMDFLNAFYIYLSSEHNQKQGLKDGTIQKMFRNMAYHIKLKLEVIDAGDIRYKYYDVALTNLRNKIKSIHRNVSKQVSINEDTAMRPREMKRLQEFKPSQPWIKNGQRINRKANSDYLLQWIYLFINGTGLRISDCKNVKYGMIRPDRATNRLKFDIQIEKTDRTQEVYIPAFLMPHIETWYAIAKTYEEDGGQPVDDQILFFMDSTQHLEEDIKYAFMKQICDTDYIQTTKSIKGEEVPVVETRARYFMRFHSMRKNIAQQMMRSGLDVQQVANQLGQTNTSTTIKHYSKQQYLKEHSLSNAIAIENMYAAGHLAGRITTNSTKMAVLQSIIENGGDLGKALDGMVAQEARLIAEPDAVNEVNEAIKAVVVVKPKGNELAVLSNDQDNQVVVQKSDTAIKKRESAIKRTQESQTIMIRNMNKSSGVEEDLSIERSKVKRDINKLRRSVSKTKKKIDKSLLMKDPILRREAELYKEKLRANMAKAYEARHGPHREEYQDKRILKNSTRELNSVKKFMKLGFQNCFNAPRLITVLSQLDIVKHESLVAEAQELKVVIQQRLDEVVANATR